MADYREYNQDLVDNFSLICSAISQKKSQDMTVDLKPLEEILRKKIPDALSKHAPPDYYEHYRDFQAEYEKFRDFIFYDRLIGKNIVSLGGGFSSGKSSFLNALDGEDALPFDINPSTSVPTYVVYGEDYKAQAVNIFESVVTLKLEYLDKVAHGFGKLTGEDGNIVTEGAALGHILESIFLSTPEQGYEHIAFLDTPGYSKADSKDHSLKTDENIARTQLNSSNFILWFIQSDAGTITEADINFITSLRQDIPKLIIISKADKKSQRELDAIVENVRSVLLQKGVRYEDVYTFSALDADDYDGDKIRKKLAEWNKRSLEVSFPRNFKRLFVRCREFYEEERENEGRRLAQLNTVLTRGDLDKEMGEILTRMAREIRTNLEELKAIQKTLKELQDDFFGVLKSIGDEMGIPLPNPSEIDSLTDGVQDPRSLMAKYRKSKGIKENTQLRQIITDTLKDVTPAPESDLMQNKQQKELIKTMKTIQGGRK